MIVYYMCLYRFGYDFEIVADDLNKGYKELKKVYTKCYKRYNNENPTKEEWENAKEDIEVSEMVLNRVRDF